MLKSLDFWNRVFCNVCFFYFGGFQILIKLISLTNLINFETLQNPKQKTTQNKSKTSQFQKQTKAYKHTHTQKQNSKRFQILK